ncbi:MAG: class I SAM-dependent methyltransferase [Gammaproteobacteria bacterium]
MHTLRLALGACLLLGDTAAQAATPLEAAVAAAHRTPEFVARDPYRHPVETLAFFGVTPRSHVVEIWPGGGWWTEILAPYLREQGRYTAASFVVDGPDPSPYRLRVHGAFMDKLRASPALYDRVQVTHAGPPSSWEIAPPGSADVVLTFRNVHNWINGDYADAMFAAMFRALRPGGVLGLKEHRGAPGMTPEQIRQSGYVPEERVIEMATRAGFRLEARSEINANPRDTRDYPQGVWTLPPTLRLGEQDRERYLAIGESDRMTLKFIKPAG